MSNQLMTRREQTLCGLHAVQAALERRPGDVLRLFYAQRHERALADALRGLAAQRRVFRSVTDGELERLSGSRAHQGLVAVLVAPAVVHSDTRLLQDLAHTSGVTLVLDGVGNPHNLGALARTAAFLGARGLLLAEQGADSMASAAAWRTAEGGLESLPVWRSRNLVRDLEHFQAAGGLAVGLAMDGRQTLAQLAGRGRQAPGWMLVAGAEETGLRAEVRAACRQAVRVEGVGAVESLNVGVASGIALERLLNG
jgi:TrmH RNA methyltransferase